MLSLGKKYENNGLKNELNKKKNVFLAWCDFWLKKKIKTTVVLLWDYTNRWNNPLSIVTPQWDEYYV